MVKFVNAAIDKILASNIMLTPLGHRKMCIKCFQSEHYGGMEKMKQERADFPLADGKHGKNVKARSNKGLGIIKQNAQIYDSVLFGKKHYFEGKFVVVLTFPKFRDLGKPNRQ